VQAENRAGHAIGDPTAWGETHVGQPVPAYEDGNTCLFCHRMSVGPGWQTNRHATTLRALSDEPNAKQLNDRAEGAELVLGRTERVRFLKRTGAYGTLALLDAAWSPPTNAWSGNATWDNAAFGAKCAGCHASGVDSAVRTFQTPSLDCHTCHGLAEPEHTQDGALMLLSAKGETRPEIEISICGSCHLRGGTSKSTGLPYPNNFVPGDNLFKDFEVDFAQAQLDPAKNRDTHVMQNARDVVVLGKTETTCTSCHDIHKETSVKHTKLPEREICFACHVRGASMKTVRMAERHSATCGY